MALLPLGLLCMLILGNLPQRIRIILCLLVGIVGFLLDFVLSLVLLIILIMIRIRLLPLIIYRVLILILHMQIRNITPVGYAPVSLMGSPGYSYLNALISLDQSILNICTLSQIVHTQINLLYYNMDGMAVYLSPLLPPMGYLTHPHVRLLNVPLLTLLIQMVINNAG